MRAKLAPLVVLGIAAAGAWWLWSASSDGPFVPPSAGTQKAVPVPASASGPSVLAAAATRGAPDPGPASRAEVVRDGVPPVEPAPAVVRGRCVDPQGRALAGVKVDLIGRAGNPQRLEEHLREHGPVDWSNPPPIHTALDGRFEFRFVPPPPHEFQLWIHRDDRAPLVATWPRLSPGHHLDFGDVVLSPGVRVRGRVVDGTGAPAPRVVLILDAMHRPGPGEGALGRPGGGQTQSREDGSFEFLSLFEPGSWRVTARVALVTRRQSCASTRRAVVSVLASTALTTRRPPGRSRGTTAVRIASSWPPLPPMNTRSGSGRLARAAGASPSTRWMV